jgi:hypothetical protein
LGEVVVAGVWIYETPPEDFRRGHVQ